MRSPPTRHTTRSRSRFVPALCLALVIAGATSLRQVRADEAPLEEMPAAAQARYQAGMAHYQAHEFAAAIAEFEAAYALAPRREILFAQAQATRLGGDCAAALALYDRFLATDPPSRQIEATRLAVARCPTEAPTAPIDPKPADAQKNHPPADRVPSFNALAVSAVPPPSDNRRAPPPVTIHFYRDRPAAVLLGTATVAFAAAVGLAVAASDANRSANRAAEYANYDQRRRTADRRIRWAAIAAGTGTIFGTAAIARYVWVATSGRTFGVGGRF